MCHAVKLRSSGAYPRRRTMDRIAKLAAVTALMVLVWVDAVPRVSGQAAPADAPHIGDGGLPQFAEERGWLKLPAKWRLGNTSAVSVDAEGHVWVLHRPRTLPENLRAMAAPPVLEFDQRGNFIQGWGGPLQRRVRMNGRRTSTAFMSTRKVLYGLLATRCRRTARFSSSRRQESS